jgi:hypothetical protein
MAHPFKKQTPKGGALTVVKLRVLHPPRCSMDTYTQNGMLILHSRVSRGSMNQNLKTNDVADVLAAIRQDISHANMVLEGEGPVRDDPEWALQSAYVRMRILLEALGLPEALRVLQQIEATAATKWNAAEFDEDFGDMYLVWGARLFHYVRALETTLGDPKRTTVSKDVIEILRAAQYSITDEKCFPSPPANENEVHARIEAVLRCVFPDLLHKPAIAKQIKNFQPDTGLPSIQTLIEYKFMADEVLADTRGYISEEWTKFIYVIYETKRIKSEGHWRQLLRTSGLDANTEIIVISGEPPRRSAKPAIVQAGEAPST